ncbi:MAG: hypothetical protein ABL962_13020, partial [Fimbriimonadaceae bacterium]
MTQDASKKTERIHPVEDYPFLFDCNPEWIAIFDEQIQLIREDIHRARSEDKQIVYLSCPISPRGGGNSPTNVEIARATQHRLHSRWGNRLWVLNPAMYQMESKGGAGLMNRHAKKLRVPLPETPPLGGDYMRMWSKVLIEETLPLLVKKDPYPGPHFGRCFDAYYFLGPSDVHHFFTQGMDVPLTEVIEKYFAQRFAVDADFRDQYSDRPVIDWGKPSKEQSRADQDDRDAWEAKRKDFFRFYALRAGVNYSLGSHDEWNILVEINRKRVADRDKNGFPNVGELMSAWFDGCQVPPGAVETRTQAGYDVSGN